MFVVSMRFKRFLIENMLNITQHGFVT